MRVLGAALSSSESLMPSVAIACELKRRNHEVRFVTGPSFAGPLAEYGFARIARTRHDGPSFSAKHWGHPLHVALQFTHLEYALERFAPDVILTSHLTLGPIAIAAARNIPLVVIGPIVYPFPLAGEMPFPDFESARNAVWRWNDLRSTYHNACRELGLPPNDETLLGDRYLLQGVPELDPKIAERLPAGVQQVGPCLVETPRSDRGEVLGWIRGQRAAGRAVAFVRLDRTFGIRDPWPVLVQWAAAEDIALVAWVERNRAHFRPPAGNVLIRCGVAFESIAEHVDFIVCSCMPAPLLAAAAAGKPILIARSGSGIDEETAAFEHYGSALAFDSASADPEQVASLAQRLRRDPVFSRRALTLRAAFRNAHGPSRAADEIENAARVAASTSS